MKQKPIIRHCKNCQWYERQFCGWECSVKYREISFERLRALFCRFYTKKEVE